MTMFGYNTLGFGAFPNRVTAYRYFLLDITEIDGGSRITINDFTLLVGGVHHPAAAMTSNTAPSPLVASTSNSIASALPWYAFDNVNGGWTTEDGTTAAWMKIDLGSGNEIVIDQYLISGPHSGDLNRGCTDWTLEGSNTGSFSGEEEVLHTVSGGPSWSGSYLERTYTL